MLRIKQLRESKGLNMKEAARILEMPYTTYVNYEKGLREPTSEVLIQLADFFDTSVDHIVGRDYSDACTRHNFQANICKNYNISPKDNSHISFVSLSDEDKTLLDKFHLLDKRSKLMIMNLIDQEIDSADEYKDFLEETTFYESLFEYALEEAKKELLNQINDHDDM